MHASSLANMARCVEKYATRAAMPKGRKAMVIEVGSADINGGFRGLFDSDRFEYVGMDLAPGVGVDLVLDDPYRFPLGDECADIVISGQMMEHNKFFWLTFAEKMRVLNKKGFCFVVAPSRGRIHRYPMDYYRFYPDSYSALAEYTNSVLVDCWLDWASPWGDLMGVFIKTERAGCLRFDTTRIKGNPTVVKAVKC